MNAIDIDNFQARPSPALYSYNYSYSYNYNGVDIMMLPLFQFLLSVICCIGSFLPRTIEASNAAAAAASSLSSSSSTFQLLYDGIVSPHVLEIFHNKEEEEQQEEQDHIPYLMVSELSTSFMTDVIQTVIGKVKMIVADERTLDMDLDQRCYQDNHKHKSSGRGTTRSRSRSRCTIDHHQQNGGNDVWIHMDTEFYSQPNHNQTMLRLQVMLTYSSEETTISTTTTSTTPDMLVKDVLVDCIPKINEHIQHFHGVVWSIDERWTPLDVTHPSTVAESQHRADLKASSVTTILLAQPSKKNRMRLASNITHTNAPWEVWQYDDVSFSEPVRSIFVHGQLITTSHPAGTAHAEALVHPALISIDNPGVVVIVSLDPTLLLKEVLKHKAVKKVVLLGMDRAVATMTQTFMPIMDDCSFLGTAVTSCLKQPIVEIVEEVSAKDWMKASAEAVLNAPERETYDGYLDVVLVDVPLWSDEWLDVAFHKYIYGNLDDESLVIIAAGSQPKLFDTVDDVLSPRDNLIRQAVRMVPGLQYQVATVYDEPLAAPLASTFLVFFVDQEATSYASFVRINSPAIETDLIAKLHTNIAVLPTLIYDGMTHRSYNTMSRAWEHWYCKTLPGRNLPICNSFLERWYNANNHFYGAEVRQDPVKGRSLVAVQDCPAGSFVLPHDAGLSMRLDRQQWLALNKFVKDFPEADMYKQLRDFVLIYGFESEAVGTTGWSVSIACNNTFTNHGCTTEQVNTHWMPDMYFGEDNYPDTPFSPPMFRKSALLSVIVATVRDVKAGEEIMVDYSTFRDASLDTTEDVGFQKFLSEMCDKGIGLVPANEAGTQEIYESVVCSKDDP